MLATLSVSQLYWNGSIGIFFMRYQAYDHFVKFYEVLEPMESGYAEDWVAEEFEDFLESFEEFCYEHTPEEITKAFNEFMGR